MKLIKIIVGKIFSFFVFCVLVIFFIPVITLSTEPEYRDCTRNITGVSRPNLMLGNGIKRAKRYVNGAIRALARTPAGGSNYDNALDTHYLSPTPAERARIRDNFRLIRRALSDSNFICNSKSICGREQAFWTGSDDLIHICPAFWKLSITCRAVVIIHEASHDVGIAPTSPHPPNRGGFAYPSRGDGPPIITESTATRIRNADAYAFFAAQIWRGGDMSSLCGARAAF